MARADPRNLKLVDPSDRGRGRERSKANILGAIPPCPTHLRGHARRQWTRTAKLMVEAGLLSDLDLPTLEAYCTAYKIMRDADALMAAAEKKDPANRGLVSIGEKGTPYMGVQLQIQIATNRELVKLGQLLGLNPSSRASIDSKGKGGTGKPAGDGAKKYSF